MNTIDKQNNVFKKTCKWLDSDNDFHMTKCLKNWALREVFLDKIKELGVKYPEVYTDEFSENCIDYSDDWHKCFDGNDKIKSSYNPANIADYTDTEKKAIENAKSLLKDGFDVLALYKDAKKKHIAKLKKQMQELQDKVTEMENSKM